MRVASWLRERRGELVRFGTVGGIAFVVDLGVLNLVYFVWRTPLAQDEKVITANVLSAIVATVVAWLGNRLWAFSHRRARHPVSELAIFGLVNAVALAERAATAAIGAYVLHFTSQTGINIAAIIGIGIGTITRYFGYRRFVFTGAPGDA
jgi:putative flippase GtrA